jgi:hypothetical protein
MAHFSASIISQDPILLSCPEHGSNFQCTRIRPQAWTTNDCELKKHIDSKKKSGKSKSIGNKQTRAIPEEKMTRQIRRMEAPGKTKTASQLVFLLCP